MRVSVCVRLFACAGMYVSVCTCVACLARPAGVVVNARVVRFDVMGAKV